MDYDIIVIGAGSGGLNIASFMNKIGFKVLLIEKSDANIGGDCLNFGCVPSKALIHVTRMINLGNKFKEFGLKTTGKVDLAKVMDYVKNKQGVIREHENADYFRLLGMDVELGTAKFISKNKVKINNKAYSAKKIVIATGSRPRKLDIPGINKIKQLNNENVFNLKKLPSKMIVIGGGPIGIEIGQAFSMLGSKVTIIHHGSQILSKEDDGIATLMYEELRKQGINILLNINPKKINSKKELIIVNEDGIEDKIKFDEIFVSVDRQLNIENLNLEKAGIEISKNRIVVDKYLRTTNKNVLLCGDIVGSYQFTHTAEMHASVILNNFFRPFFKKKIDYSNISWVTYTTPEIATFGLNPNQLKKYEKLELGFSGDDRAIVDDYTNGKLILYIDKNKILGGTMIAPNAGELIQELVLAQNSKLDIKNIFNKTYAYPVATRINKKIITTHYSNKLTNFKKRILMFLY